jgi:hypothetical protein
LFNLASSITKYAFLVNQKFLLYAKKSVVFMQQQILVPAGELGIDLGHPGG